MSLTTIESVMVKEFVTQVNVGNHVIKVQTNLVHRLTPTHIVVFDTIMEMFHRI